MSSAGRNDLMPASDRNDLMPAQEKLEWVTPKISLMGAADSLGKALRDCEAANSAFTSAGPKCTPGAAGYGPS